MAALNPFAHRSTSGRRRSSRRRRSSEPRRSRSRSRSRTPDRAYRPRLGSKDELDCVNRDVVDGIVFRDSNGECYENQFQARGRIYSDEEQAYLDVLPKAREQIRYRDDSCLNGISFMSQEPLDDDEWLYHSDAGYCYSGSDLHGLPTSRNPFNNVDFGEDELVIIRGFSGRTRPYGLVAGTDFDTSIIMPVPEEPGIRTASVVEQELDAARQRVENIRRQLERIPVPADGSGGLWGALNSQRATAAARVSALEAELGTTPLSLPERRELVIDHARHNLDLDILSKLAGGQTLDAARALVQSMQTTVISVNAMNNREGGNPEDTVQSAIDRFRDSMSDQDVRILRKFRAMNFKQAVRKIMRMHQAIHRARTISQEDSRSDGSIASIMTIYSEIIGNIERQLGVVLTPIAHNLPDDLESVTLEYQFPPDVEISQLGSAIEATFVRRTMNLASGHHIEDESGEELLTHQRGAPIIYQDVELGMYSILITRFSSFTRVGISITRPFLDAIYINDERLPGGVNWPFDRYGYGLM